MTWNGGGGGGLNGEYIQDHSSSSLSSTAEVAAAVNFNFNSPTSALLPWVLFGPCALAACTFVRAATARRWLKLLRPSSPPSSSSSISPLSSPSSAHHDDESDHQQHDEIVDGKHQTHRSIHFHHLERQQHLFEFEQQLFWLERQSAAGASAPYCLLLLGGGLFQVGIIPTTVPDGLAKEAWWD